MSLSPLNYYVPVHQFQTTINVSCNTNTPGLHFNVPAPVIYQNQQEKLSKNSKKDGVLSHRRAASDQWTINEDEEEFFPIENAVRPEVCHKTTSPIPVEALLPQIQQNKNRHSLGSREPMLPRQTSDGKYHSWSKQHSGRNSAGQGNFPVPRNPGIRMVDASTQTTFDVGTQTTEFNDNEDYMIQAARLLILGARQSTKSRLSVKSVSFSGGSRQQVAEESAAQMTSTVSEYDLINDLNDLEGEIAMMRFKAMTLQEQIRWLNQEKVLLVTYYGTETNLIVPLERTT